MISALIVAVVTTVVNFFLHKYTTQRLTFHTAALYRARADSIRELVERSRSIDDTTATTHAKIESALVHLPKSRSKRVKKDAAE